jgi:uncharacterized tellurite resistance protein B-like protein
MNYLGTHERKNVVAGLIAMAKSDGTFNMAELTYLIWVAQKLGMNQSELMQLANEDAPAYAHISPSQRIEQFHRILNMMFIDGKVEPAEIDSCKSLAYNMGLNRNKVDLFMTQIAENSQMIIELEDLKRTFEGI